MVIANRTRVRSSAATRMMRLSRPPPTRNLRVFCIAARHRSFKLAADELHLTPSAVSHQMKELEEALGVELFVRKSRALELTAAASTLLEEIEPLLTALDRSLAQVARRGGGRRTLRILLPPFFASELFIPRLTGFCAEHREIDIQIDTRDPRPSLHPPGADVSILLADAEPQGVQVSRLFALSLTAVCAPQHAATVARLGSAALRELPLIIHKPRPCAWASWAEQIGLQAPEPKNVIELDTMYAAVRAAERGVGIALVPSTLCEAWFRSGSLVRMFATELATADTYFLVSRRKDAARPEIRALTEWALGQFRDGAESSSRSVEEACG
ncbi:MAG TPA: LysR substrate-binding domain-containing protein [Steroidobacteraceae bacterium]|nr:LysR substrate-binding domain-containing protein [Steroidobacteraceae bacterium]